MLKTDDQKRKEENEQRRKQESLVRLTAQESPFKAFLKLVYYLAWTQPPPPGVQLNLNELKIYGKMNILGHFRVRAASTNFSALYRICFSRMTSILWSMMAST